MNTALILSENELNELIRLRGSDVSEYLRSLVQDVLSLTCDPIDIVATLQEKRLARWDGQTLTLDPFLKLLMSEVCTASSIYEPSQGSYALECPNMHILLTRYEWAEGMWRIAPFKDKSALISSLN